ncbi:MULTISPECIES: ABC transporter permease [unclassified Streptomyces]|jgi:peptide/nickel transport system permease protein|uniref:ABC transporter permease n=1 Tax=unclassified Streptomyces TaxID=2593676 RepID=UPI00088A51FF|nr:MULTISPECIES: ABC transporter permease [unclassified Streptomyces]MDX2730063.1 ABC transporter permease [Streptomyces sp. PA03-2a]SCY46584.1 peptide/nickel transport system permease protein [Streptomyces sp. 136MFCol5.1]
MTAPIETTESQAGSQPESVLKGVKTSQIEGRSLGRIAWNRFKRDKVAVAGGIVVILLVLLAVLSKPIQAMFGLDPNEFHQDLIDPALLSPKGSWGGMSWDHPLGVDPQYGRDILSRIIEGSWVSLLVAGGATLVSVIIGVIMGVTAGFYGGWADSLISRTMDVFLAFPLLLFAISISASLQDGAFGLSGLPLRIAVLIFVIGFFSWPYMGRIVRAQTLSLREREFVEAARSLGARGPFILLRELLPNLVAPILVYSTLLIPTNILFEAGLSYLGVGIAPPQASWGGMLSTAAEIYQADPQYMIVPGLAIFITVLAFNLLGDGLRDALDPRSK